MYDAALGSRKYGMSLVQTATPDVSGLDNAVTGAARRGIGPLDPDNPMLWLVGIAAVTLGFVSLSTSARFGPVRASVSAGK